MMSMADISHSKELARCVVVSGMVDLMITIQQCRGPIEATWVSRMLLVVVVIMVSDRKGELGTVVTCCGWAHAVGLWESVTWLGGAGWQCLKKAGGM